MRILFVAGGGLATAYALAPLATAARNAGHQVVMAANDDVVPAITGSGLPAVSVSSAPITRFIYADRFGDPVDIPTDPAGQVAFTGEWFARMSAEWLGPLERMARVWKPDVVVGGTMSYAAGLLARRLGVPYVRHAWDAIDASGVDEGAVRELLPELAELGLDTLPVPEVFIDVCPPALAPDQTLPAGRRVPMRWVPTNGQRALEPWMYTREDRPRVCLTTGSRVRADAPQGDFRRHGYELLLAVAEVTRTLDVDLLVAAPDESALAIGAALPGVQAGWIPLDVMVGSCDLLIHHGGGTTALTGLSAGVPQVIIPQGAVPGLGAERIARHGAAVCLTASEAADDPGAVADACQEVLKQPSYTERAREAAAQIAAMSTPSAVVSVLEKLS
ncbi:nucleotide disphospho-sugar-binding domain-containing protein [Kineosporia sp. NBRC 101731]|uniref:nucleotide disphospho-sugar-binding domain-containing protein n=1 Tax=Kineosporia sp. NBRC 101731 TaxID=3032199 RepID=UPI0024A205F4|nr:nucleotide disphospho-sugar-binding domain-containing protein [Kineosporia sp. NBRC 101731]GLY32459.1 dNTP-hexose glycosyl transferase [Kineosporia sp. NBRC 101731]